MRTMTAMTLPILATLASLGASLVASPAHAGSIQPLHHFVDTGTSPSNYGQGSMPQGELLQASDGNFYGTTIYGGTGLCPNRSEGGFTGCGTIFRITAAGAITTLYSFPFETSNNSAPNGAFPTAGLIEGKDGFLYGVAQDGGHGGCNGAYGCGSAFRISKAGAFTRLHLFSPTDGVGGRPLNHLVQAANGLFYGTANEGGFENEGTIFAMNTSGVTSLQYQFHYEANNNGYDPTGALLVGQDGKTLYGTTTVGGVNGGSAGGGTIFSFANGVLTVLHSFDDYESTGPGTYYEPQGALIYGPDGNLYGTTSSGGQGGALFSISPTGANFTVHYTFNGAAPYTGESPDGGPVLGKDGLIYGLCRLTSSSIPGSAYRYSPATGRMTTLAFFSTNAGGNPVDALIEGSDKYLYGTTTTYGGSNSLGTDVGTVFRINPALAK